MSEPGVDEAIRNLRQSLNSCISDLERSKSSVEADLIKSYTSSDSSGHTPMDIVDRMNKITMELDCLKDEAQQLATEKIRIATDLTNKLDKNAALAATLSALCATGKESSSNSIVNSIARLHTITKALNS
ncbi:hypothetical protein SmJEL517_g06245 [Synchytrium microbalum]|uniref:Ska2 N-terminal domain-containing protein n=1 Tax=Synchytrium microbalum TaxID=1806994 RepID=A0A507BXW0_9FUNG|nr:uncharacterized protein SmJEL517_g06245 [Synchytrium microbalum]TPX30123.1 hypothetical protein SmJEL517_g06245 [Synchytrium microbalum]